MGGKRPRSESPEASASWLRQQTLLLNSPPIPQDERSTDLAEAKRRISRYTTSEDRPHDEKLKVSLEKFLEMLSEDGRAELVANIKSKPGDEGLYQVFRILATGLKQRS